MDLNPTHVADFINRDWGRARRAKDRAIFATIRRRGTHHAFVLAQGLLNYAATAGTWWKARDRKRDLAELIELKERLTRASTKRRSTSR